MALCKMKPQSIPSIILIHVFLYLLSMFVLTFVPIIEEDPNFVTGENFE